MLNKDILVNNYLILTYFVTNITLKKINLKNEL